MTTKQIEDQIAKLTSQLAEAKAVSLPKAELQEGEVFTDLSVEQLTVLRTSYLKNGTKTVRVFVKPGGRNDLRFENYDSEGEVTRKGNIASNVPFPVRKSSYRR